MMDGNIVATWKTNPGHNQFANRFRAETDLESSFDAKIDLKINFETFWLFLSSHLISDIALLSNLFNEKNKKTNMQGLSDPSNPSILEKVC